MNRETLTEHYAPELSPLKDTADMLSEHGVQSRYPDGWREIEQSEMSEMVQFAKEFRRLLIPHLNI